MRHIIAAALIALVLVGCDKSIPTGSSVTEYVQDEAAFGENSMYYATLSQNDLQIIAADTCVPRHDSLRHVYMLDSLRAYLSLTDEQFASLTQFGDQLKATLDEIRAKVITGEINRLDARLLVKAARDQFVESVKSILTADQLALYEQWLTDHWKPRPPRPRHGGRGGHHGGPGGGGPGGMPGGGPGGFGDHRP